MLKTDQPGRTSPIRWRILRIRFRRHAIPIWDRAPGWRILRIRSLRSETPSWALPPRLANPVDSLAASRDPNLGSRSWARFPLCGGPSLEIDEFPEVANFEPALGDFEQIEQCARGGFRVTQGSVPRAIGDAEVSTQLIQVVAAEFGDQPARKFSGTQHRSAIGGKSTRIEGAADEPVIEGRIVGDEGRRGRSIEPANK